MAKKRPPADEPEGSASEGAVEGNESGNESGSGAGSSRSKNSRTRSFGAGSRISHDASAWYSSRLNQEIAPASRQQAKSENALPAECENRILLSSSESMSALPDNCVHLMVTSPPYNATKEYDDDLSLREYLEFLQRVFAETWRVLVDGGRACVNIANLGRKPYIPLSDYISLMMIDLGFNIRGEIIWAKGAGAGVSMAWGSWLSASNPVLRDTHEYILVFAKGSARRSATGKESTISRDDFMEWTKSVWHMNTESARRVKHPAPFPVELPRRCIELYTFAGDVVLDPFMGSGTTAVAASEAGRRYIGYETSVEYAELANARLAKARTYPPPSPDG